MLKIKTKSGDLFEQAAEAYGYGMNTYGEIVGIAKKMKKQFPNTMDLCFDWCHWCTSMRPYPPPIPGNALLTDQDGKYILHLAIQRNPKYPTCEEWVRDSLSSGLKQLEEKEIASLAIPLLGADVGLSPEKAREIISEVSEPSPIKVYLVLDKNQAASSSASPSS